MVSVDQLEILLRSVPQYFLFGALALFIFGWIEKKSKYSVIAEILLAVIGIAALIVLLSKMIPSPLTEGLVQEHIEMVIKMLVLLAVTGALALISLSIRIIRKAAWMPLVFITFALALFLFFSSTKLSKIRFQLNTPVTTTEENRELP